MPDGPLDFQPDPEAQPGDVLLALADVLLDAAESEVGAGGARKEGEGEGE